MRRPTPRLLAFLVTAVTAVPAVAAERDAGPFQFGNVIYTLPGPDWAKGKTRPYAVTLYTRRGDGVVTAHVTRGGPWANAASLEDWTRAAMARFNADRNADGVLESDRTAIVSDELRATKVRSTPAVLDMQLVRKGDSRRKRVRVGIGVRAAGDRAELVVLDASDADALKARIGEFTRFAENLKLVSKGAAPVIGPPTPGDLAGVYAATVNSYGIGGFECRQRFLVFGRAGRFRQDLPDDAPLAKIDLAADAVTFPADAGVYHVAGGQLHLDYADGVHESGKFQPKPAGFEFDGNAYAPVPLPPDGLKLAGTFTSMSYTAFPAGGAVTGGVSSSRSYTFAADGRWSLDQFAGATANTTDGGGNSAGGVTTISQKNRAGQYTVTDGLLTLTADDGTITRRSILAYGDGVLLVLNGSTYLKQDHKAKR